MALAHCLALHKSPCWPFVVAVAVGPVLQSAPSGACVMGLSIPSSIARQYWVSLGSIPLARPSWLAKCAISAFIHSSPPCFDVPQDLHHDPLLSGGPCRL